MVPADTENKYGAWPPPATSDREYGVSRMPVVSAPSIVMAGQAEAPVSDTVRTLPGTLEMVSVALFPPGAIGVKPTTTDVDCPPPSVVAPGMPTLNSAALGPVIWNGVASVTAFDGSSFVIVTELVADAPISSDANAIDAGVTLIPAAAMPVSATVGAPSGLAI